MVSTSTTPVVLSAATIDELPEEPIGTLGGATHRVLWRSGGSMAGVLTVAGGHRLGPHAHRVNHHHVWVLDGDALVLGEEVGPGAYVHVPAGVEHDIDARATSGCTVFYLYLTPEGGSAGA